MVDIFYLPPPSKVKPGPSVLKIKQHRPWLCPLFIVVAIVLVGWGGLSLCQRSTRSLDQNLRALLTQRLQELQEIYQVNAHLEKQNKSLVEQNKEFQDKMASVVQNVQVDQETYAKVLQSLSQLQGEQQNLIEELAFYKKLLISPNTTNKNIVVNHFTLNYDKTQQKYSYQLTLTCPTLEAIVNEGYVQIDVIGKIDTKKKRLSMKQLTENSISSQPYEILYFQRLNGYLKLPKEFSPENVVVRISPQGQQKANEVTFKWTELQHQEQPEYVGKP